MKKLLMAAVAVSALLATPALAAEFAVSGSVAASCGAVTDKPIAFGALTIGADGTLTAGQSKSSDTQDVYCNGVGSTISVSAIAMTTAAAASDANGFTRTINYTTNVALDGTNFGVGANQALGARSGALIVSANNLTANSGLKPYAGSYSGAITVTLSPSL